MTTIDSQADIRVGRPLPRETLRTVERGYLVTCTASHCDWQGLFPDPELAASAAERHYQHERRSGEYHYGKRTYTVVELVDRATACTLDESQLGLSVEENRLGTRDGGVREVGFPRTTGDVSDIVERGDRIELPPDRYHKVYRVSETRSYGLPTWTVIYVEEDVDLTSANRSDYFWKNEQIARDGQVYRSYGSEPLAAPSFEVVGTTDHQGSLAQFAGGESA